MTTYVVAVHHGIGGTYRGTDEVTVRAKSRRAAVRAAIRSSTRASTYSQADILTADGKFAYTAPPDRGSVGVWIDPYGG